MKEDIQSLINSIQTIEAFCPLCDRTREVKDILYEAFHTARLLECDHTMYVDHKSGKVFYNKIQDSGIGREWFLCKITEDRGYELTHVEEDEVPPSPLLLENRGDKNGRG